MVSLQRRRPEVHPRRAEADPLAELVRDLRLDLSQAPHTVTGSGGHHYWFTKPTDVQLLDSLEDYPGVEFKSHGRQVVAAGSVHPCGRRYEWDDLSPDLDDAPELPATLLRLTRRPVRAHGDAAGLGELTPEMLAASLEHLDPCDFQDHDSQWLPLMMACHHATNGDGRQEFIDWSTQDPRYSDDAWTIGRRWDSLHASPTGGRRGRPVSLAERGGRGDRCGDCVGSSFRPCAFCPSRARRTVQAVPPMCAT
ncbi:bifunctional DNA primase/polymerase [Stenotrophomonas maltophilia]|nr:bifunctional DNA primase/polymerase [Stenotrophomonas maltophilia]